MSRLVVMSCALAVCGAVSPAEADLLSGVLSVPRAVVNDGLNRVTPGIDLSQTVPSARDIRSLPMLPAPGGGRLLQYPGQVVGYGLNVHPGARTLRQNGYFMSNRSRQRSTGVWYGPRVRRSRGYYYSR